MELNPTHVGWVGLGWVEFFFTHHGGLGQKIPSTWPNPTHVGWVGLGWVEFFLTHHGGLGQKIPSTWPTHTPIGEACVQ